MADEPIFEVRATAPHELRGAADTMRHALLNGPMPDDLWAKAEPGWDDQISISAWQGEWCVGHAGAFRFDTVVPGGARVATAGVTRVGVLPTATRQGLLTRMVHQLLVASRSEGRVLARLVRSAARCSICHPFRQRSPSIVRSAAVAGAGPRPPPCFRLRRPGPPAMGRTCGRWSAIWWCASTS